MDETEFKETLTSILKSDLEMRHCCGERAVQGVDDMRVCRVGSTWKVGLDLSTQHLNGWFTVRASGGDIHEVWSDLHEGIDRLCRSINGHAIRGYLARMIEDSLAWTGVWEVIEVDVCRVADSWEATVRLAAASDLGFPLEPELRAHGYGYSPVSTQLAVVEAAKGLCDSFDPERDAADKYESMDGRGHTLRELLEDSAGIKEMYRHLYRDLCKGLRLQGF